VPRSTGARSDCSAGSGAARRRVLSERWPCAEPGILLCVNEWRDRGLLVNFADLGGADPCSAEGRVGGIELKDELAAQAGWETDQGVRVDDA
jgi:hypothetical protein